MKLSNTDNRRYFLGNMSLRVGNQRLQKLPEYNEISIHRSELE